MENNLEQYNSKRHKIFILWEYTKQLLGFINTLENRTVNLEKQIKSLNVGTNKSQGMKKVEVNLPNFENISMLSPNPHTKGNTIITYIFPSLSWDSVVMLVTYVHNLNITSYPILASLQFKLQGLTLRTSYVSTTHIYSRDNNSITMAIPDTYQFGAPGNENHFSLTEMKISLFY